MSAFETVYCSRGNSKTTLWKYVDLPSYQQRNSANKFVEYNCFSIAYLKTNILFSGLYN